MSLLDRREEGRKEGKKKFSAIKILPIWKKRQIFHEFLCAKNTERENCPMWTDESPGALTWADHMPLFAALSRLQPWRKPGHRLAPHCPGGKSREKMNPSEALSRTLYNVYYKYMC
jgi:hypothetical protein